MGRVKFLDGWRGCAILAVLFSHFITSKGLNFGRFGVELFFVLSGRLMAEILFIRQTPLTQFFPRRFSRVYPALLIFCTIILSVHLYSGDTAFFTYFLACITFTYNYAQFFIGRSMMIDHIWSLCIEEHVYVLLGLIALAHRRRRLPLKSVLAAMICAAIANGALLTAMGQSYFEVYWRTDVRGASILIGALSFLIVHDGNVRIPPYLPVVLAAVAIMANANVVPDPLKYSIGTLCLGFALAGLPQAAPISRAALESRPLLLAGLLSYSMYLYQQPFYQLLGTLPERLLHLGLAIGAAVISFRFVEQPARAWLNGLLEPRRDPATETHVR